MSNELSKKHGFIHFNDNWHEECFGVYRSICNERYQPKSTAKKKTTDWEAYFGRTVEEFLAEREGGGEDYEYVEFMLIELIKLSQNRRVVADMGIPIPLLVEISEPERIACMLTSPELLNCKNYGKRDDHREFLECIMSLNEPEKKIAVQDELFRIGAEKLFADVREHGLFSIVRTNESTVTGTLAMLEEHFGL